MTFARPAEVARLGSAVLSALAAIAAGCSSASTAPPLGEPTTAASGGVLTTSSGSSSGAGGAPTFVASAGAGGSGGGAMVCTAASTAAPLPVNIVFMFDRSDSMNEDSKWDSCVSALTAFFADPASQGLSASLQYFCGSSCDASDYQMPAVPLTALPETTMFSASMAMQNTCSGTPTDPALAGAIAYAKSLNAADPLATSVVALVTDGEPSDGCGGINDVAQVAMGGVSDGVKTYVIGVGSSLTKLNMIADAGGTTQAFIVATNAPDQIEQDFQVAIDQIRGETISCNFAMPSPPQGETLDIDKVNVTITQADGTSATVPYAKDCAAGPGWHYDDVMKPTAVELCAASCDAARASPMDSVQVVFGCATEGEAPK